MGASYASLIGRGRQPCKHARADGQRGRAGAHSHPWPRSRMATTRWRIRRLAGSRPWGQPGQQALRPARWPAAGPGRRL